LLAELVEDVRYAVPPDGKPPVRFSKLQFSCLEGTWRATKIKGHRVTGKGNLLAYLNPSASERENPTGRRRVMDRNDVQQLLLPVPSGG
jgi:hypothetical protein